MEDLGEMQSERIRELRQLAESGTLGAEEREIVDDMLERAYEHMRLWSDFTHKFHVNPLDVALKDVEFTEADITEAIDYAAIFFGLLSPRIKDNADTVAKIVISDQPSETELSYNWHALRDVGLITKDALLLCLVHEMSHEYLWGRRFMLFRNEMWIHELAADYICGAYSWMHHLTIGHYKLAVGQLCATLTHPDGKLREDAFVYGYLTARDLWFSQIEFSVPLLLRYLPDFVFANIDTLAADWAAVKALPDDPATAPVRKRKIDISYKPTLDQIVSPPKLLKKR